MYKRFGHKRGVRKAPEGADDFGLGYGIWHDDKKACLDEGHRVLCELVKMGDEREWVAFGFPDPLKVKAKKVLPYQFVLTSRDLRDEQAQNDS